MTVPEGQIYYLQEHRRTSISFDTELRAETIATIDHTRNIFESGQTPPAVYDKKKCDRCSLLDICMPHTMHVNGNHVRRYMQNHIRKNLQEDLD
ncbi:CRISPR-associated RecB family exonuclease Cas4 [Salinispira pacifica]|uniref:CRISPR-associated RecB family exonuclease Cas4 n=1 Tax=Salinispira pacifica TaxID=1307761 RepID=V5WEM7_9SPIO|nr:CRISPR-associated RecB family exonuclease Cas4 [Salinispira pacifica]